MKRYTLQLALILLIFIIFSAQGPCNKGLTLSLTALEPGALPNVPAYERVETYDPRTNHVFSFPGYDGQFLNNVFTAEHTTDESVIWTETKELTGGIYGSYWGRSAVYGNYLYFSGKITTPYIQYTLINDKGEAQYWQYTTDIPYAEGAESRSLHQFVPWENKMYVIGGWYSDKQPAYDDIYYAPINTFGSLGDFVLAGTLPFGTYGHSTVINDGIMYFVKSDKVYIAPVGQDGMVGEFVEQMPIPGLKHKNYGNCGIAIFDGKLIIVDDSKIFVCDLANDGSVKAILAEMDTPESLGYRSVYTKKKAVYIASAGLGKIFRLDGLN